MDCLITTRRSLNCELQLDCGASCLSSHYIAQDIDGQRGASGRVRTRHVRSAVIWLRAVPAAHDDAVLGCDGRCSVLLQRLLRGHVRECECGACRRWRRLRALRGTPRQLLRGGVRHTRRRAMPCRIVLQRRHRGAGAVQLRCGRLLPQRLALRRGVRPLRRRLVLPGQRRSGGAVQHGDSLTAGLELV
jgi:hypothetical protein